MSCHGCASKFSIFSKELSCPNCGFSFCGKCLKQKAVVAEKEQKVCNNCFKRLNNLSDQSSVPVEPPALLLKRLESLEDPTKPPITIYREVKKTHSTSGLSQKDKEILERLKKLKEDQNPKNPASETEIKRRLAILQGRDEGTSDEKPKLPKAETRSEQEQINDLLRQFMDETSLDSKVDAETKLNVEEIEKRLQALKGFETSSLLSLSVTNSEAEDTDTITSNMIKQAIAEANLEKKVKRSTRNSESDSDGCETREDELPWCIICNEDAVLRCLGCDGSLYCASCFKEGHDYFEMKEHETVAYSTKNA